MPSVNAPPFPTRAVAAISGAVVVLLLLVANRYGWHRDELYFLEAGRHHLQWGYVDQPPFTPFIARLADAVAADNLVVLRLLPALSAAVAIHLGALLVRELGGSTRAQVVGAVAVAGGFTLGVSHLLSTATFDFTAWLGLLWIVARLLRTDEPRWWLAFGGLAGVAMLNKNLVPLLAASVLVGMVVERRWRLVRSPWLVAGGALAVVLASPNLLWQARNRWPQFEMAEALADRIGGENRATLVPLQLVFLGPPMVVALVVGAKALGRDPALRRMRPLLWAWPFALVVTFASGGRPYYPLPLTTVVMLAGVAAWRIERIRTVGGLAALSLATSVPLALPVLPSSQADVVANVNETIAEQIGWPAMVDQVAAVIAELPADERGSVVLLTRSYGEAGALDRFGPARGLPPAYSGHNGYADFRQPSAAQDGATVVAVRYEPAGLRQWFDECEQVATVDNGVEVESEMQGTPIVVCRGLRGTWPEVWDEVRFLS